MTLVRLAAYVRRHRIDVIHAGDRPRDALYSTILSQLTGRKLVIQVHIKWYPNMGRFPMMALRRCDAVIAISEFTRRSFVEGGIRADKIQVALNTTDTNVFDPACVSRGMLRSRFALQDDTPIVGVVGRIMLYKGQLELIDALDVVRRAVPDVRLVIVGLEDTMLGAGAESYRAQVERRIAQLDLEKHVLWAGWSDAMPAVMADLDVLAVPSWEEPFGLVVTEGMAMERPVVSFRSGALPEIICDGVDGLLVEPKDAEAMGRAIAGLLADPVRRKEIGARARRTVIERFTPNRQADDVERIYRSVIRPT
jgi:glycosyltransferase involved in cell wall biosynthesis